MEQFNSLKLQIQFTTSIYLNQPKYPNLDKDKQKEAPWTRFFAGNFGCYPVIRLS
jgi:hypothetical protein